MTKLEWKQLLIRWLRFNLIGLFGIVVQFLTLAALHYVAGWHYLTATAVAVQMAVLHNFVWHERWTWRDRAHGSIKARALRLFQFFASNGLLSLAGNLLLMPVYVQLFDLPVLAANLAAIASCSLLNFMVSHRVVFSKKPQVDGSASACSLGR
jgi:putative flippase GtrA